MRIGISLLCLAMFLSLNAFAAGLEKYNDCLDTNLNICERAGFCAVDQATWYQHATVDKADNYDTQEWDALCEMVHVRLIQGDCVPFGAQDYVTAYLSATSNAFIPQITDGLACGRIVPHSKP